MVNIGGDVRVVGTPSSSAAWRIEVEDPRTEQICAAVELLDGGVATSTTLRRRWRLGSSTVHHLIDPRRRQHSAGPDVDPVQSRRRDGGGRNRGAGRRAVEGAVRGRRVGGDEFRAASAFIIRDDGSTESHGPMTFEPLTFEAMDPR